MQSLAKVIAFAILKHLKNVDIFGSQFPENLDLRRGGVQGQKLWEHDSEISGDPYVGQLFG